MERGRGDAGALAKARLMALLTINSGSSSLKFGVYADDGKQVLLSGKAEDIGKPGGSLSLSGAKGKPLHGVQGTFDSQQTALATVAQSVAAQVQQSITAVGHRIVHGGPELREHCELTDAVLATLEGAVHFAPLHIPPAMALVRASKKTFPQARQFACFDTQFHTTLPPEAYTYPLPRPYREAGVRRYGFHGLSYESIVRLLGEKLATKTVVAHLGSGSSVCALRAGVSVDTSMGVSPCGGVLMDTRSGDLDPGVGLLLERTLSPQLQALTPDALEDMLNHRSGIQALTGTSDMRALTERAEAGDTEAELALTMFVSDVAKTIAGYATVLGGLEMLVFTGGIGERSAIVRRRIGERLRCLGVLLMDDNEATPLPELISNEDSRVRVLVQATDEDGEIARHVARLV